MKHRVIIKPQNCVIEAENGTNVLSLLRREGIVLDAPCGGSGRCGMCRVEINGVSCPACKTEIEGDCVIVLPHASDASILGADFIGSSGSCIGVDIGTTTVVCSLIREGKTLKTRSCLNPQRAYGADVVSRLRNYCPEQTALIRRCIEDMICELCPPDEAELISVAANPAMQQIFLGMGIENLVKLPFEPRLRRAEYISAAGVLPGLENAKMLIIPQPAAYVGADTLACVMAAKIYEAEKPCLLVDIGTNAEMALGCRDALICCAAAAGPALEGADISCGMRAEKGAIDRVRAENGTLSIHAIGDEKPRGICGSGIVDAASALLDMGRLDKRGRIVPKGDSKVSLADGVALTQEDIRKLQLAKAAICGGVLTLCAEYGIEPARLERVYIAGGFGSFIDVHSACRIGLLPAELEDKAQAIGNAALSGAAELALDSELFRLSEDIAGRMQYLELGSSSEFRRHFAENMYFK